jgi:hypothetical protein
LVLRSLRLTISHEKSRESIKNLISRENYFSVSLMSAKKPDRYGKGMRSVSTTVSEEIFAEMERLAGEGGLKLTAWARHALTDTARAGSVYGITDLKKLPKSAPITLMAAEEPGNISELPVPGSSPAKTPIRYQKGIGRKSAK